MRAAVVSDLHLGTHSGADLLRRPEVRVRSPRFTPCDRR